MYLFTATSKLLVITFRENLNLAYKKQYHHLITRLHFFREMLSSEKYLFPKNIFRVLSKVTIYYILSNISLSS